MQRTVLQRLTWVGWLPCWQAASWVHHSEPSNPCALTLFFFLIGNYSRTQWVLNPQIILHFVLTRIEDVILARAHWNPCVLIYTHIYSWFFPSKFKYPILLSLTYNILCCSNLQVKESLFQRCLEVEQTAREQATDNVILDQLQKVSL